MKFFYFLVILLMALSRTVDSFPFNLGQMLGLPQAIDIDRLVHSNHLFNRTIPSGGGLFAAFRQLQRAFRDRRFLSFVYSDYRGQYGKSQPSGNEFQKRLTLFRENVQKIAFHNLKAMLGQSTFDLGVNQFSDLTEEEALSQSTGLKVDEEEENGRRGGSSFVRNFFGFGRRRRREALPENVNWLKDGYMTPVKDQGRCSSCVLFTVCAALEAFYKKEYNVTLDLSEQQGIDCPKSQKGVYHCRGNYYPPILDYMKANALTSEKEYPYEGKYKECRIGSNPTFTQPAAYSKIEIGEESLKEAIAHHGPVLSAVHANWELLYYHNGILSSTQCNKGKINHAVLTVGYGVENGEEFWLVRNSWGPKWGEDGYFRLKRNDGNMCKIATYNFIMNI